MLLVSTTVSVAICGCAVFVAVISICFNETREQKMQTRMETRGGTGKRPAQTISAGKPLIAESCSPVDVIGSFGCGNANGTGMSEFSCVWNENVIDGIPVRIPISVCTKQNLIREESRDPMGCKL
jgi:hypothetical protein